MNASNRRSLWWVVGTLICIFLIGVAIASAQSTPPSIPIGQLQAGALTDATSTSPFAVTVTSPQNINVQILATSQGFATAFRVFDASNAVIFQDDNAGAQNILQDQVTLASPGTYVIEVRSANNMAGQFAISIQPGAPFNPPIPLLIDQPVTVTVDPQNPRQVYSFTALTTDALFVEAASTSPDSGPVVHLVDANSGDTYGLANAHLTLGRFRMPIGTTNYLVEVTHSGSTFPESTVLCLWPEHGVSCSGSGSSGTGSNGGSPNPTAVPTQSDCTCQATVSGSGSVDIHAAPPPMLSLPVGILPANTPAQVIGELPDHSWIEISYNGVVGWVRASDVTLNNFCDNIPTVTPPPPPPTDVCTASAKLSNISINVRQFPLPAASIVGTIQPGDSATVLGHTPNGLWLKVNYNGIIGWVLASVVTLSDNCDNIPVATPPPGQLPTRPPLSTLPPGRPTLPPRLNPTNTPPLPPPPLPSATPVGPCLSAAACPPTSTPRFQLQPTLGIILRTPIPTATKVVIK